MLAYLQGLGIGAGLIVAIGAQNAFVLSQGVRRQHTWVVALICSLCDAILIFMGAAGVGAMVAQSPTIRDVAAWGGALFLFYYGFKSLRAALGTGVLSSDEKTGCESITSVVAATLAVTLLNPHVYLDTLVLIGSVSGQFTDSGRYLFAFGASSASFLWFFSLSLGGVMLAPLFKRRVAWRILDSLVCLTMWGIAFSILPSW